MITILKQTYVPSFCDTAITDNICAVTSNDILKLRDYLFDNYGMTDDKFEVLLKAKKLNTRTKQVVFGATTNVTLIIEQIGEI